VSGRKFRKLSVSRERGGLGHVPLQNDDFGECEGRLRVAQAGRVHRAEVRPHPLAVRVRVLCERRVPVHLHVRQPEVAPPVDVAQVRVVVERDEGRHALDDWLRLQRVPPDAVVRERDVRDVGVALGHVTRRAVVGRVLLQPRRPGGREQAEDRGASLHGALASNGCRTGARGYLDTL
jgi:hypothetical protein